VELPNSAVLEDIVGHARRSAHACGRSAVVVHLQGIVDGLKIEELQIVVGKGRVVILAVHVVSQCSVREQVALAAQHRAIVLVLEIRKPRPALEVTASYVDIGTIGR